MATTRYRSSGVPLGITALLAAGLSGCGSSPDYGAVCVDQVTQTRVVDQRCDGQRTGVAGTGGGGAGWYYIPSGGRYPSVGSGISGGSYVSPPSGQKISRGGSSTGGTVSKGGFGSRGGGGG